MTIPQFPSRPCLSLVASVLLSLLLPVLLAGCQSDSHDTVVRQPAPPPAMAALNCAPEHGWLAGLGKSREQAGCRAESSGQYLQAWRLGQELRAIEKQLEQKGLTGAERSRLLQERETLVNIARMRGWVQGGPGEPR